MITERLMAAGEWELSLAEDTPRDVLTRLDFFGHLIVTAAPIESRIIDPTEVLAASIFTGIVRRHPAEFSIGGPGLAVWMGDEDGKGYLLGPSAHGPDDFPTWFARLVPGPPTGALTANAVTGTVPGTLTYEIPIGVTLRSQLDYVCSAFGAEWRVNPDFTVDGGLADDLYGADAVAIISRIGGGRDIGLPGIRADIDSSSDAEDYTTDITVDSGTGAGSATLSPPTSYLDPLGNSVVWQRYIKDSNAAGNETGIAEADLAATGLHAEISLETDLYNVKGDVAVGANVFVYAPELGLTDTANRRYYDGELLAPALIRTTALEWAWREGMGGYYRAGDGTLLDLTNYLVPETSASRIEVGSIARTLLASL